MPYRMDSRQLVVRADGDRPDPRDRSPSRVRPDRWVDKCGSGINYSDSLCFGTPLRRCSIQ